MSDTRLFKKVGSICESALFRDNRLVDIFDKVATLAEKEAFAQATHDLSGALMGAAFAATSARKKEINANIVKNMFARAEIVTGALVRECDENVEIKLVDSFAALLTDKRMGGDGYDTAAKSAGAPSLASVIKKAYAFNAR